MSSVLTPDFLAQTSNWTTLAPDTVVHIMRLLSRGDCWNVWQLSSHWAASARQVACFEAQPRITLQRLVNMLVFVYIWRHYHRNTQLQFCFHLTEQLHPRSLVLVLRRLLVSHAMVSCFLLPQLEGTGRTRNSVSFAEPAAPKLQDGGQASDWQWSCFQDKPGHLCNTDCILGQANAR